MHEVEIKAVCDNHEIILEYLKNNNAQFVKKQTEIDLYFCHPAKEFSETDEALRLRTAGGETVITYKGPKIGQKSKTRIEEEVAVADYESMKKILTYLGFTKAGEVKKSRSYYLLKDIDICLDYIEGLGFFVELEIQSDEIHAAEQALFSLAADIGLKTFERKSYLELLLEKK